MAGFHQVNVHPNAANALTVESGSTCLTEGAFSTLIHLMRSLTAISTVAFMLVAERRRIVFDGIFDVFTGRLYSLTISDVRLLYP